MLLLVSFVVLGSTSLFAQERDQDRVQDQDRTKLVMINGEVLQVQERAQIRLQAQQRLNDGTTLYEDGTFQTMNREKLRLRDGECIDTDGIKYRNEYQYHFKVQQENMGLTRSQIRERNRNRVHYVLVDGEVMQIHTQSQNILQDQVDFGNGVVMNPDGAFQTRERKQLRLLNGECLNTDGEIFKNTYQHRKMKLNKNMKKRHIQSKPKIQKKRKIGK